MQDPNARLSFQEFVQIAADWKHLVHLEQCPNEYDGKITDEAGLLCLSRDKETLEFSGHLKKVDGRVVPGHGTQILRLELAGADFQRVSSDSAEWEDVIVVFPPGRDDFTLRKWKSGC
jgi:hypothetical protein